MGAQPELNFLQDVLPRLQAEHEKLFERVELPTLGITITVGPPQIDRFFDGVVGAATGEEGTLSEQNVQVLMACTYDPPLGPAFKKHLLKLPLLPDTQLWLRKCQEKLGIVGQEAGLEAAKNSSGAGEAGSIGSSAPALDTSTAGPSPANGEPAPSLSSPSTS